jgi:predicted AAA+ superfamily ATPase
MIKMTEIADQNPWWRHGQDFIKNDPHLSSSKPIFINRLMIPLEKGRVYFVQGPRRIGKTTYLKKIAGELLRNNVPAQQIYYLSAESFTSRREFRNALQYYVDSNRGKPVFYIMLDEITSIRGWDLELQAVLEPAVMQDGVVIATASQVMNFTEKTPLLSGVSPTINRYSIKPLCFREFIFQLSGPLSTLLPETLASESIAALQVALKSVTLDLTRGLDALNPEALNIMLYRKELDHLLRIYLTTGGFPLVINNYLANMAAKSPVGIDPLAAEVLIRDLLGDLSKAQKQEAICRHLLKVMIERYGRRYSYSNLAREVEITHVTAIDYLRFFEDSFLGFIVYAYDFGKRAPKYKGDKKVYFLDPFLLTAVKSYLTGDSPWAAISAAMDNGVSWAKVVEGVVLAHLLTSGETPGLRSARDFLWFYYDKTGREMGNIINADGAYLEIDLITTRGPEEKSPKKISQVPACIRLTPDEYRRTRNRLAIPLSVFLALISPSAPTL